MENRCQHFFRSGAKIGLMTSSATTTTDSTHAFRLLASREFSQAVIHHAVRVLVVGASLVLCSGQVPVHGADPAWKPQRNVELVVGAQAGGSNDRFGRLLQKVQQEMHAMASMTVGQKQGQENDIPNSYIDIHTKDP